MSCSSFGFDHLKQRVSTLRLAPPSFLLSKKQYQYTPLEKNQIRLLKLYPGGSDARICCSLHAVDLFAYDDVAAESPIKGLERFDSISYVWGDSSRKVEILCDEVPMHVTVNLADALRRFRDPVQTQVLWADALCINQKDKDERAAQVKLMGLIYFKARKVRIWLGRDDEVREQDRACHAVQLILRCAHMYATCGPDPTGEKLRAGSEKLFKELGMTCDLDWTAMHCLFRRPWFTRVWVVQELGLSRDATFYCGDTQFSRRELSHFQFVLLYSKAGMVIWRELNMQMIRLGENYWSSAWGNGRIELGQDPLEAETFFDILRAARGLRCTDPRDMIYAFLGHPSAFKRGLLDVGPYHWYPRNYYTGKPTIISPNYDKSNKFPKLCMDLAITAIKDFDIGLNMLSHIAHDYSTIDKNVSWVPRWDLMSEPSQFLGSQLYYAASDGLPSTKFQLNTSIKSPGGPELSLKALYLGKVWFSLQRPTSASAEHIANTMAQLLGDIPRRGDVSHIPPPSLTSYPYDDTFLSALGTTLTAGLTSDRNIHTEPADEHASHHLEIFQAYHRQQQAIHSGTKPSLEDDDKAYYFLKEFTRSATNRALLLTLEGRFGLGPTISDWQDEIWLPMGAKMPFVFRPTEKGTYRIVGQTYLYGVMRGEAVKGKSERDFKTVVLE